MVAHLLSLKWRLLLNGFRRSPAQLIGLILGGLYAIAVVTLLVVVLMALRWAPAETANTVVVLGGASAMLGWTVIPLVASAADQTLDPSRFTTAAIPTGQLLAGLALAGFIGVPGFSTALVAVATAATWSRSAPAVAGALAGAVLGSLTCVVLSKVVTTATASLAASRRFKDVSSIVFVMPLMLIGPIVAGIAQAITGSGDFLRGLAEQVAWTPLGAAWSLGGELYAGNAAAAGLQLVIAAAGLALLFVAWSLLLKRALVTHPMREGPARARAGWGCSLSCPPARPAR